MGPWQGHIGNCLEDGKQSMLGRTRETRPTAIVLALILS
jgi:hypothetical protein